MAEFGASIDKVFPDVKRYAGVAAMAMPEHVVVRKIAPLGDLRRFRFEFLQANHIGLVALQPLAKLRFAGPDAVDVPGSYFHRYLEAGLASLANQPFAKHDVAKVHATATATAGDAAVTTVTFRIHVAAILGNSVAFVNARLEQNLSKGTAL
jgi:hypothetical protein